MAETIAVPTEPIVQTQTTPVETISAQPQTPESTQIAESTGDILTRVSRKKEVPKTPQDVGGTFKEFDDIADPVMREKLINREKERVADYTRKTQDLARQREEYERFKSESQNWTPERIQRELLNNPQFLTAAQSVSAAQNPAGSGLTDEQFSALTPTEKNQLSDMNRQLGELRQQNFLSALNQKDALLQAKYGDYDALKINQGIQELSRMNPLDVREQAYKALFHDEHVRDAYEEGLKEGKGLTQQRIQAVSNSNGFNTTPASQVPKKEAKETDMAYFQRLAQRRIDEAKGLAAAKR